MLQLLRLLPPLSHLLPLPTLSRLLPTRPTAPPSLSTPTAVPVTVDSHFSAATDVGVSEVESEKMQAPRRRR
ncbi:hypothetical protein A2U01_0052586 [Trifolium medium]|uniref:Uncharacterized protein n=1 Tax=Trifolium medium TaxID=97028 RepID=A0A392R5J5_9FABA|nr:hypothetical protein [Trifolium medium]